MGGFIFAESTAKSGEGAGSWREAVFGLTHLLYRFVIWVKFITSLYLRSYLLNGDTAPTQSREDESYV